MYFISAKANIVVMTAHAGGLQDRILLMGVTGGADWIELFCCVGLFVTVTEKRDHSAQKLNF